MPIMASKCPDLPNLKEFYLFLGHPVHVMALTNPCKNSRNVLQFSTCFAKHYCWSDKARQWSHPGLIISTIGNHFLLDRLIYKMRCASCVTFSYSLIHFCWKRFVDFWERGTFSQSILPQQSCSKASNMRRQPEIKWPIFSTAVALALCNSLREAFKNYLAVFLPLTFFLWLGDI